MSHSIFLFAGLLVLYIGMQVDLIKRSFPNALFLLGGAIGLVFAFSQTHGTNSLIAFLMVNLLGILCINRIGIGAGDMKYLSICFFFFNPFSLEICIFLIWFMLLYFISLWIRNGNTQTKKMIYEAKDELRILFLEAFVYPESLHDPALKDKSKADKQKLLPLTVPAFGAVCFMVLQMGIQGGIM
ncbi:A24 family peptidase [Ileibacterium valens]|uniref:A24 family peptidase n=1 Tax=Ileibacterium valens TaxID=1862668 RepID=UPI00256FA9C0|nr:A24 family peptidase [Ileibacterium valens]